jgi:lysophospholipase L1-like esterase
LGSTTIERFDLGRAFPGAATLNRGIGDEPAALLLERLDVGIDWAAVDGVVLYAASVDFRRLLESAAECTARVEAVLAAIRARAPTQPLLLLGLLSQRDLDDPGRQRLIDLDKQLARLAARFDATYLPLDRAPLTEPDGTLSRDHSVDRFHLNQSGYQVLAEWIRNNGGPLVPLLFP